jgi:hypothetical protein
MPMMCYTVMVVVAMLVVVKVSALAKVQEAATAAAEEVDDWRGGWQLCIIIYFSQK